MKVVLEFDPVTGNISDLNGTYIACCSWLDFDKHKTGATGAQVDTLTKLKDAGFEAEEIIDFHRRGIIG